VEATHGTIIEGIKVFKDKPKDFLIDLIPKLKLLTTLDNEVLFEKGDQAEELYFIFDGSILLYTDLSDIVDMKQFQSV
jgi:CRP-like cAMP-binding protein